LEELGLSLDAGRRRKRRRRRVNPIV